jgi:hypothetical protein
LWYLAVLLMTETFCRWTSSPALRSMSKWNDSSARWRFYLTSASRWHHLIGMLEYATDVTLSAWL